MISIGIYNDESKGYIHYEPKTKEVVVSHPSSEVRTRVYKYLTNEREVKLSNSDKVGDFVLAKIVPTDNQGFLEISLCEMFHNIGVHVDWSDKGERVVKSGKVVYEIIN